MYNTNGIYVLMVLASSSFCVGQKQRPVLLSLEEYMKYSPFYQQNVGNQIQGRVNPVPQRGGASDATTTDKPTLEDRVCVLTESKVLVGVAEMIEQTFDLESCVEICENAKRLRCLSGIYYKNTYDCILTGESRLTLPELYINETYDESIYFDFDCDKHRPKA